MPSTGYVNPVASARAGDDVRVLDLRSAEAFAAGHAPGAVRCDPTRFNRAEPPFAGLLPDAAAMRALVRRLGLRPGRPVVVLDGGAETAAARAVWALHAWGIDTAAWLDGGWPAWTAAGLPVERGAADDGDAPAGGGGGDTGDALAAVAPDDRVIVSADALLAELDDPGLRVLDVRGAAEYAGTDVRAAEGGHVPGAIHLEWTRQLDGAGRALPVGRLRADLAALDVRPDHRVVVYCQSHQRSAVTWTLMRGAGYPDVRGLDGAWSVWGNRPELPKERG